MPAGSVRRRLSVVAFVLATAALVFTIPASGRTRAAVMFRVSIADGAGTIKVTPAALLPGGCISTCDLDVPAGTDLLLTAKSDGKHIITGTRLFGSGPDDGPGSLTAYARTGIDTGFVVYTIPKLLGMKQPGFPDGPPAVPDLTTNLLTAGEVTLTWGGDSWIGLVRRGTGRVCPKSVLDGDFAGLAGQHAPTPGFFTDTSVTPGSAYCYAVFPLGGGGVPGRGVTAKVVAPTASTPPAAPTVTSLTPAAGLPGTRVRITGRNLQTATAVDFANVPGELFWPTSSGLVVVVPGVAHTAPITIHTPGGTVASSPFSVYVPVIKSFKPTSGRPGDSVTIVGQHFENANTISFGTGLAYYDRPKPGVIVARVPADATTGPIRIQTVNGDGLSATPFTVLP